MSHPQKQTPTAKFCLKCQNMYGSPIFDDMCSICYKNQKKRIKEEESAFLQLGTLKDLPQSSLHKKSTDIFTFKADENINKNDGFTTQKEEQPQKKEEVNKMKTITRCLVCTKKTGLLGYSCKHCSNNYCKHHRLPEDHKCEVDFVEEGKKKLKLENPAVGKAKIQKI